MKNNRWLLIVFIVCSAIRICAQTQDVTVLEYCPAPGQFVNIMPETMSGMTQQEVNDKCTEAMREGIPVHLGTYGGYMTVGFDHPIQNLRGSDIRIKGNAFYDSSVSESETDRLGGSIEPGIVYVGVGDDVETAQWYELAGSEYYTSEIHDFAITYYKPTAETGTHALPFSIYDDYIRWEATWTEDGKIRDSTGCHMKNVYHRQSYWPSWIEDETLTYKGGKLPNNAIDKSGKGSYWVLYRYSKDSYGYVDASLNTEDASTFDIDLAVDEHGNHVELKEINFIKVVCGVFQHCGWLGETSTEVSGFEDLHLLEGYDDNPIVITPRIPDGIVAAKTGHESNDSYYYDLSGRRILFPSKGIYIRNGLKVVVR